MTTGFLYDPRYLDHDTGSGHPERKERLSTTLNYLQQWSWFEGLERVEPRMAEREWIESTHDGAYIQRAEETCRKGIPFLDSMDVAVSPPSYEIALLAAGGALALADKMMAGEVDNGFALLRPPGHHAEHGQALGFCLFNNVAILARYLQKKHGLERVLILDWDVHHGNGTQHTFEEDPTVMYASLHQYPFYPGTGAHSETGIGRGEGTTVNCPMPAGARDPDYEKAFREVILPKVDAFRPNAVLVSAGFDAHADDPLAEVNLTTEFYGWMTERMMEVADKHAEGRILSLLEGGYHLTALSRCVSEHLKVMAGINGW